MTQWYQQAIDALQLNGKGQSTQEAYVRAVRMLSQHFTDVVATFQKTAFDHHRTGTAGVFSASEYVAENPVAENPENPENPGSRKIRGPENPGSGKSGVRDQNSLAEVNRFLFGSDPILSQRIF